MLLAGCAAMPPSYIWVRPNTVQAEFDADRARCAYEAEAATATYGSSTPASRTLGGSIGQGLAIGYGKAMEFNKLGVLCMQARGYSQQAIGDSPSRYGAAPVPVVASSGPTITSTPDPRPAPAALVAGSKHMFAAERYAKSSGCATPVATITIQSAASETFTLTCANAEPMIVRCDGACRALQ